jgi:hypothetical protein
VHALVAFHLHERPQARIEFVSNAADAAILIEVAVGVARIFAVGEQRRIVSRAIERTFEGNRDAVELVMPTVCPTSKLIGSCATPN